MSVLLLFQTRDCRPPGGKLLAGAAAVQLSEKPSIRAGASRRTGAARARRPPLARRAVALHRHRVCVSERAHRSQAAALAPHHPENAWARRAHCVQHTSWPPFDCPISTLLSFRLILTFLSDLSIFLDVLWRGAPRPHRFPPVACTLAARIYR